MVSLLGLRRRLPPVSVLFARFRSTAPPPRATCGIELTVSVSTVMFLTDPSPDALLFGGSCVKDFLVCTVGGFAEFVAAADFLTFPSSPLLTSALLFPPLSLPLSTGFNWVSLDKASSIGFSSITSGLSLSGFFPPVADLIALPAGVFGKLASLMASKAGPLPLVPRFGVRIPDLGAASSSAASESLLGFVAAGPRLGRSTRIVGVEGED